VEGRDWPLRMSGREPCIWARLTEGKGCKKKGEGGEKRGIPRSSLVA